MSERFAEFSDQEVGLLAGGLIRYREQAEREGLLTIGAPTPSLKLIEELRDEIKARGLEKGKANA